MFVCYHSRRIINWYLTFINLKEFFPQLKALSNDESVPKFASHLIHLTKADNPKQIEKRVVNSIFGNNSKWADLSSTLRYYTLITLIEIFEASGSKP